MKKTLVPILIGVSVTFIFCVFAVIRFVPLERLETLAYDIRYHIRGKTAPPPEVVIVGIDDRSLGKIGRWPWDRGKVAQMVTNLNSMGAKVILMDIIFSEPSRDDAMLEASFRQAGNVILPIVFDFEGEQGKQQSDVLYDYAIPIIRDANDFGIFPPISAKSALLPLENMITSAKALGHINMIPDKDGVLRWEVLAVEYNGEFYPSIDLQAARMFMGLPMEAMTLVAAKGIQLGNNFIGTDYWGRILIHYYGPEKTFPMISAVDILERKVDPAVVKDKIILVGATAVGIYDLRVTPASAAMAGIEKHASVVASILHNQFIKRITNLTNILIILFSGIIFSLLIVRLKALYGALLSFIFIAAIFIITYHFFFQKGLWVDLSYSSNNILIIYFVVTAYRYATEERYARQIRSMFSSYVTEKVVNELIKNPNLAKLGGDRREVTVLFSDIRSFTTFSEKHSPEEVVSILNEYLGEMTRIIFECDGTLDKFVGDEIVAFWGAPLPQDNHAEMAAKCALQMEARLKGLQEKWVSEGKAPLAAGYGLNTGEVIVGNIGAEGKKMDYTVIGDNVNLGARVEGLTRKYNANIIITDSTLAELRDAVMQGTLGRVKIRGLGLVAVKGKAKPVGVYELVAAAEDENAPVIIEVEEKEVVQMKEK